MLKKIIVIFLSFMVLTNISAMKKSAIKTNENKINKKIKLAEDFCTEQNYKKALPILKKLIENKAIQKNHNLKNLINIRYLLGACYMYGEENFSKALTEFKKALDSLIKIKKKQATPPLLEQKIYLCIGNIYNVGDKKVTKDTSKALENFNSILRFKNTNPETLIALLAIGRIHHSNKKLELAENSLKECLDKSKELPITSQIKYIKEKADNILVEIAAEGNKEKQFDYFNNNLKNKDSNKPKTSTQKISEKIEKKQLQKFLGEEFCNLFNVQHSDTYIQKAAEEQITKRFTCANCKKTAPDINLFKKCSLCRKTFYCSKKCQKNDWKSHKDKCGEKTIESSLKDIVLRFSETKKGNYSFTRLEVDEDRLPTKLKKCHFCKKEKEKLKTCTRCKEVQYCSKKCQKNDWKNHKKSCVKKNKI